MKVVIANSIGVDSASAFIIHSPSRWSEGVKKENWFAYYPWELAYLSSLLKRDTGEDVKLIDGCLEKLQLKDYRDRIMAEKPDWLIIESASRMIDENIELALGIKRSLGTRLVFTGAHASVFPEVLLDKGIDFVCIGEYEATVLELIQGKDIKEIQGLYPNARRDLIALDKLPWPEDEDVRRMDYSIPGEPSSYYREIQFYASRGCAGSCEFCVARNVYYSKPNWRPRRVEDITAELGYLRDRYDALEGIFFDEEVHNGNKRFILELTSAIRSKGLDKLHYEAMCDIGLLDEEMADAMLSAGYYMIRAGIESGSDKINGNIRKSRRENDIYGKLSMLKKRGLKTYGTFMFGARGATSGEDMKTVELMERLIREGLLDNLQLSICTPLPGTPFYSWARDKGYLVSEDFREYDGGNKAVISYPGYTCGDILWTKYYAMRLRDHLFLWKRINSGAGYEWLMRVIRKHGFFRSFVKALMRIFAEMGLYLRWGKK